RYDQQAASGDLPVAFADDEIAVSFVPFTPCFDIEIRTHGEPRYCSRSLVQRAVQRDRKRLPVWNARRVCCVGSRETSTRRLEPSADHFDFGCTLAVLSFAKGLNGSDGEWSNGK